MVISSTWAIEIRFFLNYVLIEGPSGNYYEAKTLVATNGKAVLTPFSVEQIINYVWWTNDYEVSSFTQRVKGKLY